MSLYEILYIISIVFFVLAGIGIITAVAVFFLRNVPDVQADLSGKKRAAAVAEIAAQRPGRDRRKGVARVEPTSGTLESGELKGSGPLDNPLNQVPHVESVVSGGAPAPVVSQPVQDYQPRSSYQVSSDETESDDSVTVILGDDSQPTTILQDDSQPTTILQDDSAPTDVLPQEEPAAQPVDEAAEAPVEEAIAEAAAAPAEEAAPAPAAEVADDAVPIEESGEEALDGTEEVLPEESAVEEVPAEAYQPAPAYHTIESDDSATTILQGDDSSTTILQGDDSATTILSTEPATPAGFVIVRKIVLRESTEVITTG